MTENLIFALHSKVIGDTDNILQQMLSGLWLKIEMNGESMCSPAAQPNDDDDDDDDL